MTNDRQIGIGLAIVLTTYVIIVLGEWLGLIQPLTSFLEKTTQPVVVKISQLMTEGSRPIVILKKSFAAARRVQELEQDYSQSLAKISSLEYLEQENQELRRLLELQDQSFMAIIAVPVISRGQPSISAGEAEGIKVGQPVLMAETVVGLIGSTSQHQAVVNLLAQNVDQPILVKTESGAEGLLVGNGKDILLTELPREAEISVGERVITLGQEQLRPQLIIGKVQQFIDQPSASTRQAIITQEVSFYEAAVVEVLP